MIIYGKQVVTYAANHPKCQVETLYLAKEVDPKLFSQLQKSGARIERVDSKKAQAMAKGGNHQGMLAKITELEFAPLERLEPMRFVVMTAGVSDMGNLGAIVRSAWALGAEAVIIGGIASPNLAALVRTSSGAALDMPLVCSHKPMEAIGWLKQRHFYAVGATLDGTDHRHLDDLPPKRLLVLGAEGAGLPGRIERALEQRVTIAMAHRFDSLNVAAAAAILIDRMRP
jgi:23S rRNA (guanosine2251-2'-O)-methyltransferase